LLPAAPVNLWLAQVSFGPPIKADACPHCFLEEGESGGYPVPSEASGRSWKGSAISSGSVDDGGGPAIGAVLISERALAPWPADRPRARRNRLKQYIMAPGKKRFGRRPSGRSMITAEKARQAVRCFLAVTARDSISFRLSGLAFPDLGAPQCRGIEGAAGRSAASVPVADSAIETDLHRQRCMCATLTMNRPRTQPGEAQNCIATFFQASVSAEARQLNCPSRIACRLCAAGQVFQPSN